MYGQGLGYCASCRANHTERSRLDDGIIDLPLCEETNGTKCEKLSGKPPYELYGDNWLPITIYKKVIDLSPSEIINLTNGALFSRPLLSVEALKFVLTLYQDTVSQYSMDWLLQSITLIQNISTESLGAQMVRSLTE